MTEKLSYKQIVEKVKVVSPTPVATPAQVKPTTRLTPSPLAHTTQNPKVEIASEPKSAAQSKDKKKIKSATSDKKPKEVPIETLQQAPITSSRDEEKKKPATASKKAVQALVTSPKDKKKRKSATSSDKKAREAPAETVEPTRVTTIQVKAPQAAQELEPFFLALVLGHLIEPRALGIFTAICVLRAWDEYKQARGIDHEGLEFWTTALVVIASFRTAPLMSRGLKHTGTLLFSANSQSKALPDRDEPKSEQRRPNPTRRALMG